MNRFLVLMVAAVVISLGAVSSCAPSEGNPGGTGGGAGGGAGGGQAGPNCPSSTAKSGSLCQANWFCDAGELAAYCGQQSDGGYDCACGPSSANPVHFASPNVCEQSTDQRLSTIASGCGF